jgi:hypothetical protein
LEISDMIAKIRFKDDRYNVLKMENGVRSEREEQAAVSGLLDGDLASRAYPLTLHCDHSSREVTIIPLRNCLQQKDSK